MLDNVNTAINNILTGGAVQAYSISGRNIQKCTLKELRELKADLETQIAAGSADMTVGAKFQRPG